MNAILTSKSLCMRCITNSGKRKCSAEMRENMKQDMIVILDLGSTENTTIARQIRELGVYSEIHPHDIT